MKVRGPAGKQVEVQVHSSMTIGEVKSVIETHFAVSVTRQRLIAQGKQLKDAETVSQAKLQPGFVVQLLVSEPPVQDTERTETEPEDSRPPSQM